MWIKLQFPMWFQCELNYSFLLIKPSVIINYYLFLLTIRIGILLDSDFQPDEWKALIPYASDWWWCHHSYALDSNFRQHLLGFYPVSMDERTDISATWLSELHPSTLAQTTPHTCCSRKIMSKHQSSVLRENPWKSIPPSISGHVTLEIVSWPVGWLWQW